MLVINLDETFVPFYYGNVKGNLAITNKTLPKGSDAFDTGSFSESTTHGVGTRGHYMQHTGSPKSFATSLDSAFPAFTYSGFACGAGSNASDDLSREGKV